MRRPLNTSGGQISAGRPGLAGGDVNPRSCRPESALVPARQAHQMGLVSEVVEGDALPRALELAEVVAGKAPPAGRQIKEVVRQGLDAPLEAGLRLERHRCG
ncbi:hypothetical protein ACFYO2_36535 [Streptomyces sp. NPDC006602]|uniref:hypothetical protein n=1 Tax=Streptomyces sp. NPDC006602 TaxID=3364751 RepID=UPI0036A549DE